jgi:hypothetical protein
MAPQPASRPIEAADARKGDLVINAARAGLPVFRLLGAPDRHGYCRAERLGGARRSTVAMYPSQLPGHLRVVREVDPGGAA